MAEGMMISRVPVPKKYSVSDTYHILYGFVSQSQTSKMGSTTLPNPTGQTPMPGVTPDEASTHEAHCAIDGWIGIQHARKPLTEKE